MPIIAVLSLLVDGYQLVLKYMHQCLGTSTTTSSALSKRTTVGNTSDNNSRDSGGDRETASQQQQQEELEDVAVDWNTAQAAGTPTLLPALKFHDLVFGAILGEGAFSVVKYARHITKVSGD